jgi:hypothetical protein
MLKLFGAIYVLTAPTMMGILIIALLTVGRSNSTQIIMAAAAGAVLALPAAALIAKRLTEPKVRT